MLFMERVEEVMTNTLTGPTQGGVRRVRACVLLEPELSAIHC